MFNYTGILIEVWFQYMVFGQKSRGIENMESLYTYMPSFDDTALE